MFQWAAPVVSHVLLVLGACVSKSFADLCAPVTVPSDKVDFFTGKNLFKKHSLIPISTCCYSPVKSHAFCGSLMHWKTISHSHTDWCLSHAKTCLAPDICPQFSTNTRLALFQKENLETRLERLLVSSYD